MLLVPRDLRVNKGLLVPRDPRVSRGLKASRDPPVRLLRLLSAPLPPAPPVLRLLSLTPALIPTPYWILLSRKESLVLLQPPVRSGPPTMPLL